MLQQQVKFRICGACSFTEKSYFLGGYRGCWDSSFFIHPSFHAWGVLLSVMWRIVSAVNPHKSVRFVSESDFWYSFKLEMIDWYLIAKYKLIYYSACYISLLASSTKKKTGSLPGYFSLIYTCRRRTFLLAENRRPPGASFTLKSTNTSRCIPMTAVWFPFRGFQV